VRTLEEATVISAEDLSLLQRVKAAILKHLPTAKVVLYGSVARGTQHEGSDYDLLVLTDRHLSMAEERVIWHDIYAIELERDMDALFNVIFCSESQWGTGVYRGSPLRLDVEQDGIVL
jgi:predicted nucleotidyltransferase